MFPTCSNRLLAGRNALSAVARTTIRSRTSGGDLHAPPVHERTDRPPLRPDLPRPAAGLAEVLARDRLPSVSGRVGGHLLEPRPRAPLSRTAALGRRPRPIQALDQVI